MSKLKLSELDDNTKISYEYACGIWTVGELKTEIINTNQKYIKEPIDELLDHMWYVIERKEWTPDAKYMIENYIEDECVEMYEDWGCVAQSYLLEKNVVDKIQAILDDVCDANALKEYWTFKDEIEVDIFPVMQKRSD